MAPADPDPLTTALARDDAGWAREHLDVDIVAWLTTMTPDGRPQSSVIGFLYDGGSIVCYSQPDTPKLRNIGHSPSVAFNLQSDPYGDHYLVIEGTAAVDPTIAPWDENAAFRAKYLEPLDHWDMDEAQTARDFSVPIRITPLRVRMA